MSNEVVKKLNEQIALEFSSAYLYLGFAARLGEMAMLGAAHWYRIQAQEEIGHGMRIYDFLVRIGEKPELLPITLPLEIPDTLNGIAAAGLAHEEMISRSIENIYSLAARENDFKTQTFLVWFINEQVEEEENARDIIDDLARVSGCKAGLVLFDSRMGGRK